MNKGEDARGTSRLIWRGAGIIFVAVLLLLVAVPRGRDSAPTDVAGTEVPPSPSTVSSPQSRSFCDLLPKVVARVGETEFLRDEICFIAAPVTNVESGGGFTDAEDRLFQERSWIIAKSKVEQMVLRLEVQDQGIELTASDLKDVGPMLPFYLQMPGYREGLLSKKVLERDATEAEIESYYEARMADYMYPPRYTLRRVLLKRPKISRHDHRPSRERIKQLEELNQHDTFPPHVQRDYAESLHRTYKLRKLYEEDDQKRQQARALVEKLNTPGTDYVAIATVTGDAPEREQGGLLGTFGAGKWPEQYRRDRKKILSLAKGEAIPIVTDEGYEIIIMDSIEPRRQMSLEEARPEIVQRLEQALEQVRMEEMVRKWDGEILIPMPEGMPGMDTLFIPRNTEHHE